MRRQCSAARDSRACHGHTGAPPWVVLPTTTPPGRSRGHVATIWAMHHRLFGSRRDRWGIVRARRRFHRGVATRNVGADVAAAERRRSRRERGRRGERGPHAHAYGRDAGSRAAHGTCT
eukprot:6838878-Prymnesium_polylepis.1